MGLSPIPTGAASRAVASELSARRREAGLTQARLTEMVNERDEHTLPKQALTEIETLRRRVDVDDLVALALALGVTPHDLLRWADEQEGR